jgi:phosphoesterase RecJ-like protein
MKKRHDHQDVIDKILEILSSKGRWLVLMHEKPDGDTAGCACAVASLGLRLGKEVVLGGPDKYPSKYLFLPCAAYYRELNGIPDDFCGKDCVIICVDTSKPERAVKGIIEASSRCTVLNIDHHPDNLRYGDINWIEPSASATGEMATELLASSEWGISEDEANALYVAIVTDNGYFSFPSSSAKSHECAVTLLKSGASPESVSEELETNLSENAIRLWGRAFSRVEVFSGGRCAIYWLKMSDFSETAATRNDAENLVNFLLRIKGVRLAALCAETDEGVRASLRARAPLNAREVAVLFGGGGHNLAAGCTIREPLDDALSLLKTEMRKNASKFFSGVK